MIFPKSFCWKTETNVKEFAGSVDLIFFRSPEVGWWPQQKGDFKHRNTVDFFLNS